MLTWNPKEFERMLEAMGGPVGYFRPDAAGGCVLVCLDCKHAKFPDVTAAPAFRVNVYPYHGRCSICRETIVQPKSSDWPTLFGGASAGTAD